MKKHLEKKAMAVVTAALLIMTAVPVGAISEESTVSTTTPTTVMSTEQTTESTANTTADTTETTADKVTSETTTISVTENKEVSAVEVTEETTNKVSDNVYEMVSNDENKLPVLDASAESDFVVDSNGVLTEYKGAGGDVVIPEIVKKIRTNAFYSVGSNITSITIPDSLISLGYYPGSNQEHNVFLEFDNIKNFFVSSKNTKYSSIDGVL